MKNLNTVYVLSSEPDLRYYLELYKTIFAIEPQVKHIRMFKNSTA